MKKWYSEDEQAKIINLIFDQIVLIKYIKQYRSVTIYNPNYNYNDNHNYKENIETYCKDIDDINYYQKLVFNTNDLMSCIFQFVEYDSFSNCDLANCSLVSSHWLYHGWNPNSIYFVNLKQLIHATARMDMKMHRQNTVNSNINNNNSTTNNRPTVSMSKDCVSYLDIRRPRLMLHLGMLIVNGSVSLM